MSYYEFNNMPQRSQGFGSIGGPQGPNWPDVTGSGVGYSAADLWQGDRERLDRRGYFAATEQIGRASGQLPSWYAMLPVVNTIVIVISLVIMLFLLFRKH